MRPAYCCSEKKYFFFAPPKIILSAVVLFASIPANHIKFQSPRAGQQISTQSCTLSVAAGDKVRSVIFKARYSARDGKTLKFVKLGNITRSPFKLIWDISDVPNQLSNSFVLYAEAKLKNAKTVSIKREGVYLVHHSFEPHTYIAIHRTKLSARGPEALLLHSGETSAKGRAFVSWNKKGLFFSIEVRDPFFYSSLHEEKLKQIGVEIYIDPRNSRDAYLTEDIVAYKIPVFGQAARINAAAQKNIDGTFFIKKTTTPSSIKSTIYKEDFKGYKIRCLFTWALFDKSKPKIFACNIIATALDKQSSICTLSTIEDSLGTQYSPFVWPRLKRDAKPLLSNNILLWIVSLFVGFLIGFAAIVIVQKSRKKAGSRARFEQSEEDKRQYESITQVVQERLCNSNFGIEEMAGELAVSPKKIDRLLKSNRGESFKTYLSRSRIEIAKERLRSSHLSEAAIAESCGFSDIEQMEKYFKKFCRTTPYKFRQEYQVT